VSREIVEAASDKEDESNKNDFVDAEAIAEDVKRKTAT
jgi:hypothetical protein